MPVLPSRKNKIVLTDYNYQRDIENRLIMSNLTNLEVDVLREIIDGSLVIPIQQLSDSLGVPPKQLQSTLNKLSKTKLFQCEKETLFVDKEMRKYYEAQIVKFDEDFKPGMEYLQSLLNKVPIHILPAWYGINCSSTQIFKSIVEKYFLTPKIYETYLKELIFDDPILKSMAKQIWMAPDFKISTQTLIEKYKLTREQFEEYLLQLEYYFVCCLSYERHGDSWEEVITPFYEWHEFIIFQRDIQPTKITETKEIERKRPEDFGFILDVIHLLKIIKKKPLSVDSKENVSSKERKELEKLLEYSSLTPEYLGCLIQNMKLLNLADIVDDKLVPLEYSEKWLKKTIHEQAISLYRKSLYDHFPDLGMHYSDRDIRETEKCLKRVINNGWIYFDDFLKGLMASIRGVESSTLTNKGKQWKYTLPTYTKEDHEFVKALICHKLFEAGMVAVGTHKGKLCFCLTPFGRMSIDD